MEKVLEVAFAELGVREPDARIAQYFQATWKQDGTYADAWCAAFVSWCFQQAYGVSPNRVGARNFVSFGQDASHAPSAGNVAVILHTSGSWHVGFYLSRNARGVWLLGGNQHDSVCVRAYPAEIVKAYRAATVIPYA